MTMTINENGQLLKSALKGPELLWRTWDMGNGRSRFPSLNINFTDVFGMKSTLLANLGSVVRPHDNVLLDVVTPAFANLYPLHLLTSRSLHLQLLPSN